MKKALFTFFLFVTACNVMYAEKTSNLVIISTTQNLSTVENAWVPDSVRDELEANLQKYTALSLVSANEKQIMNLQRKYENNAFDESNALELGKLVSASHAVFLVTRKAGNNYTITLELTDLTTGKSLSKSVSSPRTTLDTLVNTTGSAVDELTIELCDKIGIQLTNTQKYILLKGDVTLSLDAQHALYNEEVTSYTKQIEALQREQALYAKSTDLDEIAAKERADAQIALAEQKLKLSLENQKRVEQELLKRQEEELANLSKASEQQTRIQSLAQEIEQKRNEVMELKIQNASTFEKLQIIEAKKKALVEIRDNLENEIKAVEKRYSDEILAKTAEINNREYRAVDLVNNNPTQQALDNRAQEIEDMKKQKNAECAKDIKQLETSTADQDKELLASIKADYSALGREQHISSLTSNVTYSVKDYNSDLNAWPVDIEVYIDKNHITTIKSEISYKELSGKTVPSRSSYKEWNAYADEIDMYTSLFCLGEPLIALQATYTVKPDEESNPSTYIFTVKSVSIYDIRQINVSETGTISGKVLKTILPQTPTNTKYWKIPPSYDIRDREKLRQAAEKKKRRAEIAAREEKEKPWLYSDDFRNVYSRIGYLDGFISGISVSFGIYGGGVPACMLGKEFSYFSSDGIRGIHDRLELGFIKNTGTIPLDMANSLIGGATKRNISIISISSGNAFYGSYGVGLDKRFHLGVFHPNFSFDVGTAFYSVSCEPLYESQYRESDSTALAFSALQVSLQVDFPVVYGLGVTCSYDLDYCYESEEIGVLKNASIGICCHF